MVIERHVVNNTLLTLSVALTALITYANSFPGVFIQDDFHIVAWNPLLESLNLTEIFRTDYWGTHANSGLFRPLTILSLYLNKLLLGSEPYGYHLVNVILHSAVAVLLLRILLVWGLAVPVAWLGALLFAVHPIHTEVVNEVVGRSELLVALFLLLAFIAAQGKSLMTRIACCGCFFAALLSKEHAVTFLVLLPIVEAYRERSFNIWLQRAPFYLSLLGIVIAWLCWRQWGVVHIVTAEVPDPTYLPLAYAPVLERFLAGLKLQWFYLVKLLFPWPLQASYAGPEFPGRVTLFSVQGMAIIGGFMGALAVTLYGWQRHLPLAVFALMYMIGFAPTSQILFPIGVTFAERLAYFPSMWFCAGLAVAFVSICRLDLWQRRILIGGMVIALLFAGVTLVRNLDFSSEIRLWQADVVTAPDNVVAWQSLGEALTAEGRYAEAEQAFRTALEKDPESAVTMNVLAVFLLKTGRYDDALQMAQSAMQKQMARQDRVRAQNNMGVMVQALIELGNYSRALYWLEEGAYFGQDKDLQEAMWGRALAGVGRCGEAIAAFRNVPGWKLDRGAILGYSRCLYEKEHYATAGELLEQVLDEPDNAAIWNFLGVVRTAEEKPLEALTAFRQALALQPENPFYRENLERFMAQYPDLTGRGSEN